MLNPASRKACFFVFVFSIKSVKNKHSITLRKTKKSMWPNWLPASAPVLASVPISTPLLPEQVRQEVSAAVSSTALTPSSPSNKLPRQTTNQPQLHPTPLDFQIQTAQVSPGNAGKGFSPSGTFHPLGRSCVCFQGTLSFPGLSWPHSQGYWLRSMLHKGPGHSSCLPLIRCVSSR